MWPHGYSNVFEESSDPNNVKAKENMQKSKSDICLCYIVVEHCPLWIRGKMEQKQS